MSETEVVRPCPLMHEGTILYLYKAKDMRCPKCGFISFDNLAVCKKCKKNIGDALAEINGTAHNAVVPLFLKLMEKARASEHVTATAVSPKTNEPGLFSSGSGLRQGIDTDFVLEDAPDGESEAGESAGGDFLMDLDEFSEVAPREEYTLDLDEPYDKDKGEPRMPSLDFGDLDISDLAPPSADHASAAEPERELAFADGPIASLSEIEPPPVPAAVSSEKPGLEDLHFQDLNLDTPAKFVSGSVAGRKYSPSVKTGTALDNFDINLGDLFKASK